MRDNSLGLIVDVRDAFERASLVLRTQLDQLPSLVDCADELRAIIEEAVMASLAGSRQINNPSKLSRIVANAACALVLARGSIGIPSLHIIDELSDFIRHELLQLVQNELAVMSIHTARMNEAYSITHFLSFFNAQAESIKALLRAVALAARDGKPEFIDAVHIDVLAYDINSLLRLNRETSVFVARESVRHTVSFVRALACERFSAYEFSVDRLHSSYIAERGLLRFRHVLLSMIEDIKFRKEAGDK